MNKTDMFNNAKSNLFAQKCIINSGLVKKKNVKLHIVLYQAVLRFIKPRLLSRISHGFCYLRFLVVA